MRRRDVFIALGLGGAALGLNRWLRSSEFEFFDMDAPIGFRRLSLGSISRGSPPVLAGIDAPDPVVAARAAALEKDPCEALFGSGKSTNQLPVAVFTDVQCPYCRVLEPEISARALQGDIDLNWHDPALLGPTSEAAAKLIIAAEFQGAGDKMRARIRAGRFVPTPAFVAASAQEFGIDGRLLEQDAGSPEVSSRLTTARALTRIFGIPGTPALVIGQTLVIGRISPRQLDAVIRLELDRPDLGRCRV